MKLLFVLASLTMAEAQFFPGGGVPHFGLGFPGWGFWPHSSQITSPPTTNVPTTTIGTSTTTISPIPISTSTPAGNGPAWFGAPHQGPPPGRPGFDGPPHGAFPRKQAAAADSSIVLATVTVQPVAAVVTPTPAPAASPIPQYYSYISTTTVYVTVQPSPPSSSAYTTTTVYITVTAGGGTSFTSVPIDTASSSPDPITSVPSDVTGSATGSTIIPSATAPANSTLATVSPLVQTCENPISCSRSKACSPDGSCICQPSVDGIGYCLADVMCSDLKDCTTNSDCGSGSACMITCCEEHKCLTLPFLCANPGAPVNVFKLGQAKIAGQQTTNGVEKSAKEGKRSQKERMADAGRAPLRRRMGRGFF